MSASSLPSSNPLWALRRDIRTVGAALGRSPRGGRDIPDLPPGRHVDLPGRGTTFIRELPAPEHHVDRPPVVLLHGWTLTADLNFHGVYDLLAREHPIVAVDTRSHGRGLREGRFGYDDVADDLVALLDDLVIERAILTGFSLGGVTAMHTALRHPDRVAGIVPQACALSYAGLRRDRAARRAMRALEPVADRLSAVEISRRYWHDTVRRHPHVRPYWQWVSAELATTGAREMVEVIDAVFSLDLRERATELSDVPSAFVALGRDRVCRPALQREAAAAIGAHLVEIPADHNIPLSRPEQYGAALLLALEHVRTELDAG